jgi:hypothetical protein
MRRRSSRQGLSWQLLHQAVLLIRWQLLLFQEQQL